MTGTSSHDYKRHGVVDLYAALEIAMGKVIHRVTESHIVGELEAAATESPTRISRVSRHCTALTS